MSNKDVIVALDIGTTKVVCVIAQLLPLASDSGLGGLGLQPQYRILGVGMSPSRGLKRGVVVHVDSTVQSIREAVQNAEAYAQIRVREVTIGIAGAHIRSQNSSGAVAVRGREIAPQDIQRVLDAARAVAVPADREILHVVPQSYTVDDQMGISHPLGMSGVRLEARVHIVTGAVTSAQNLIKCAQRAGLQVRGLHLQPIASSEAVLSEDERQMGVAMVDLGGGTSDLAIFREGALVHTAVIAMGGQHITQDLAVGVRAAPHEAERIKIQSGSADLSSVVDPDLAVAFESLSPAGQREITRREIAEIITPRVEEMAHLVQRELLSAVDPHLLSAGIVLTGGTAQLKGLTEAFTRITGIPAKRSTSDLKVFEVPSGIGSGQLFEHGQGLQSPSLATVLGLVRLRSRGKGLALRADRKLAERVRFTMRSWIQDLF